MKKLISLLLLLTFALGLSGCQWRFLKKTYTDIPEDLEVVSCFENYQYLYIYGTEPVAEHRGGYEEAWTGMTMFKIDSYDELQAFLESIKVREDKYSPQRSSIYNKASQYERDFFIKNSIFLILTGLPDSAYYHVIGKVYRDGFTFGIELEKVHNGAAAVPAAELDVVCFVEMPKKYFLGCNEFEVGLQE